MKRNLAWIGHLGAALAAALCVVPVRAEIPEPDAVIYGRIALDGDFVTADDTDVVVEARGGADGPVLSRYRMGSLPGAGDFYTVRARVESGDPIIAPDAVAFGATVHLVLFDASGERSRQTVEVTRRGEFIRLDFGDVDTDGDGMPDRFEEQYFGSATGGDPDADPDGDGRPNRREAEQGTDPLTPDGRHPADIAEADDRLTIQEVTRYSLAWQLGEAWSIEPTNIPVAYVTRAAALWTGGEFYAFRNDPETNAPMWWVNVPPPVAPALLSATPERADGRRLASASATQEEAEAVLTVLRQLPPSLTPESDPFEVRLAVSAAEGSSAYAIEEQVPEGWSVRQISHDGRWDAVNRKVKWGPFFDGKDRTFTYTAVPAAGITEAAVFAGVGSADGLDHPIGGADRVWPHGYADAPQVTARFTASGPALQVTAAAGRRYRIEISTDLVSWSDWTTVDVGDAGVLEIPMEATGDRAFFRARLAE